MNPHASGGFPLGLTISISPFGGLADGEMVMAAPRRVIEVSFSEKELSDLACVSRSRTEPASHVQRACNLVDLSREAVALCDRASHRGDAPDSRAMFATGAQVWRHGGSRRQSAPWGRADNRQPSAHVRRRSGLPQAEGFWLSARSVDDPAAGLARARAGWGCRIRLSGPSRSEER